MTMVMIAAHVRLTRIVDDRRAISRMTSSCVGAESSTSRVRFPTFGRSAQPASESDCDGW
jgi:hypothetical protein